MNQVCKYNPACDISEVQQFGYVLLSDALVNNQVPNDVGIQEQSFNEIPLNEYAGKPADVFDVLEYRSAVNENVSVHQSQTGVTAEPTASGQTE